MDDIADPDPASKTDRFVVTHADDDSAVLKAVDGGQVHTVATNPDLAADDVATATIEPEPPMEVTWRVVEIEERRSLDIGRSPEPPTELSYDLADAQPAGEVTRRERAGEGELHVLTLDPGSVDAAAEEVAADEATRTTYHRVPSSRRSVVTGGARLSPALRGPDRASP